MHPQDVFCLVKSAPPFFGCVWTQSIRPIWDSWQSRASLPALQLVGQRIIVQGKAICGEPWIQMWNEIDEVKLLNVDLFLNQAVAWREVTELVGVPQLSKMTEYLSLWPCGGFPCPITVTNLHGVRLRHAIGTKSQNVSSCQVTVLQKQSKNHATAFIADNDEFPCLHWHRCVCASTMPVINFIWVLVSPSMWTQWFGTMILVV